MVNKSAGNINRNKQMKMFVAKGDIIQGICIFLKL